MNKRKCPPYFIMISKPKTYHLVLGSTWHKETSWILHNYFWYISDCLYIGRQKYSHQRWLRRVFQLCIYSRHFVHLKLVEKTLGKVHSNASSLCLTSALSVEARFFCLFLDKTKLVLSSKSLINLNLPPFPQILWSIGLMSKFQVLAPPKASVYQLLNGNPLLCIYRALVSQVGYESFKSRVQHLEEYKQYNVRNIQRNIFQTFWKQDSCPNFLFIRLETSNSGYLLIFLFY